jgi:uncharacterized protein (DUF2147 family)
MSIQLRISFIAVLMLMSITGKANGDAILGRWRATTKSLTIEIYKTGGEYRAKILDFTDHHNAQPAAERRDDNNPDPKLRGRSLLGMDVLRGLQYDEAGNTWSHGSVYDVSSGKEYSAELELDDSGKLNVRAYKGISLLGKTISFVR